MDKLSNYKAKWTERWQQVKDKPKTTGLYPQIGDEREDWREPESEEWLLMHTDPGIEVAKILAFRITTQRITHYRIINCKGIT